MDSHQIKKDSSNSSNENCLETQSISEEGLKLEQMPVDVDTQSDDNCQQPTHQREEVILLRRGLTQTASADNQEDCLKTSIDVVNRIAEVNSLPLALNSKFKIILEKVTTLMQPYPVYAVGGCVRDYVLNIEPKDFDFTTSASPDIIEEYIRKAGRKPFIVGKKFGTLGCKLEISPGVWEQVEITTFRTEKYEKGNRKPEVKFVSSIIKDLSRRDFTINSMALRLKNKRIQFIDPFEGRKDLKNKILKCVGFPKQRFHEDPLRILRAIRFAIHFDLEFEYKTYEKLCHCASHLLDISKERWVTEMDKILMDKRVFNGLYMLWNTRIFNYIIPELSLQLDYDQNSQYHTRTLNVHTMLVVAACPYDLNLRWAALLHDVAKPFCRTDNVIYLGSMGDENAEPKGWSIKTNYIGHEELGAEMALKIAMYLKFSNERTNKIVDLIKHHLEDDCELRKYDNLGKL